MNSLFAKGRFFMLRRNSLPKNIPVTGSEIKQNSTNTVGVPMRLSVYEIGDFTQENYDTIFNDESNLNKNLNVTESKPFDMPLL